MSKEKRNPRYVTQAQCAKQVEVFQGELETIKKALVGEDMRGGLVKDVAHIKAATGIARTVVVPVVVSVSAAAITYLVLNGAV